MVKCLAKSDLTGQIYMKMRFAQFLLPLEPQKSMDMDIMSSMAEKGPVQGIMDHHLFVILTVLILWLVSILEVMMNVVLKEGLRMSTSAYKVP